MVNVVRAETYLSPRNAERFVGLGRRALSRYVRRGILGHYRTTGGHRRYALSELLALRRSLGR